MQVVNKAFHVAHSAWVESLLAKMPLLQSLPVSESAAEFLQLLENHQVIIVEAETGSGKSTGLPPILVQAGYSVLQTQPREMAARTVSARIAEVLGCKLGGMVGYRTAKQKNMDGPSTRCLVVTDGLAMVRRIMGHEKKHDVFMPDEVHEFNKNTEVLLAWVKRQLAQGAKFKVVLMSATIESEKLSEYFGSAPILRIPGRMFPVEMLDRSGTLETDAVDLLHKGRNVLIFQPGKKEINDCIEMIKQLSQSGFEILPLHSELTADEQGRCFKHYSRPKCVVSTNVAQTSVTIDDIDAVLDTGMERRIEVQDGVEGLYLLPISIADRRQRMGRAGRCKPGVYIDYCDERLENRPEFPVPEIKRSRLDQMFLKLAEAGIDMEQLEFFHQPDPAEIHAAKRTLIALGCLSEDLQVTDIGRQVARLPIKVQYARMVIEAAKRGVMDDVLTIAAILEQGGITARENNWLALIGDERQSDCLAQLRIFNHVKDQRWSKDDMRDNGVHAVKYFKAVNHRRLLVDALNRQFELGSSGKREEILRSVCAGMVDNLFRGAPGALRNTEGASRQLARESIARPTSDGVYFGQPFDLENLRLLTMVTFVARSQIEQLLPHMLVQESGVAPFFDERDDCVISTSRTRLGSMTLEEDQVSSPDHPDAATVFAKWCVRRMAA